MFSGQLFSTYSGMATAAAVFLAISTLVMLICELLLRGDKRIRNRVDKMLKDGHSDVSHLNEIAFSDDFHGKHQLLSPLDSLNHKLTLRERFHHTLHRAGFIQTNQKRIAILAITISITLILSTIYIITKFLDLNFLSIISCMLSGLLACFLMISQILKKCHLDRMQQMANALSDFMDLLVVCLESGISLDGALGRVTEELVVAHPALAVEMKQVQKEVELGTTLENAFYHLAQRTGLQIVSTMACFIEQSRRYGTSISDALREHSEMIREKREIRAESLAQQASMKILLPTLLLIFPATFVVLAGPAVMEVTQAFADMENVSQ